MAADIQNNEIVIKSGQTKSDAIDVDGQLLCLLSTPSSLGGVTSLMLEEASDPSVTFSTVTHRANGGQDYCISVADQKSIPLDTGITPGFQFIKLVADVAPSHDLVFQIRSKRAM